MLPFSPFVSRRREGARRRSCLAGALARVVCGALLCAAAATAAAQAHAPDAEGDQSAATGACSVLTSVYRTLDAAALAPHERQRLSDTILESCARTEIRLLRADALDGAALFKPLAEAPEKGEGQ